MSGKLAPTALSSPRGSGRPFVGRTGELGELRGALEEAQEGRGLLVLLSGEPGIGKTRLMQEAAREAGERGWRVAAGRCWEEGGAPAYWPWIQAVRALGGDVERFAAAAGGSGDPDTVRFRLFDAAGQFLVEVARDRPLMIVLDDLHAADAPSLVLLRFISESIADAPILIVGSYREREMRLNERRESFAELIRLATRISLQGLSVDDVESYLAGVTGQEASRPLTARLHALTGGNPFFLGEVVRAVARDGLPEGDGGPDPMGRVPDEVRTLLRRRMADLPDETVGALRVAAVIGREFHLRVLERTSRLNIARLLDILAEAGDAGVISEDPAIPRRYAFAHELVRETLYDDLAPAEAASRERHCELLLRLGDARWRAGDTRAARTSFEEAAELARRLGDGEMLARAALGYVVGVGGFLLFARFEVGVTGVGLLEEALAGLPREDSPLRARVLARLAVEMHTSYEVERRLAVSTEAIEMSRRLGDSEALVTALHARHWALGAPEMIRERLESTEEMLTVAGELRNEELAFLAHNARFHGFLELCDGPGVDAEIAAVTQLGERIGQPFYRWHGVCLQVIRAELDGRLADAERLADEALRIARLRHSEYAAYMYKYAQMVAIRWAQGRLDEYWPEIADHGERYLWVARWREALAAAERGDRSAAEAEIARHAGRGFADIPRDLFWLIRLCSLAEACVVAEDHARARILYELLLPHPDRNAVPYTLQPFGPVALRLGMLAAMLERWDDAERHFETALARCELLGARAIRARVLLEYARALVARGDAGPAAAMLAEARRLAEDLDLERMVRRVDARASAEGPVRRPTGIGARFAREGEFWTIAYAGKTMRLRDVKGLRYIAFLLAAPGTDVHVLELVAAAEGSSPDGGNPVGDGLHSGRPADLGPVLDQQAREEDRARLEDLRSELEEARSFADDERAARIEEEIDTLVEELARAAGLGGRDRPQASTAERARVNVTKAIRTAIKLIDKQSPELAEHLTASIRTGRFCSYAPPGEAPPRWAL